MNSIKLKRQKLTQERDASLATLKDDFNEWCGVLSIDEIMSNPPLIRVVERLIRMLNAARSVNDRGKRVAA